MMLASRINPYQNTPTRNRHHQEDCWQLQRLTSMDEMLPIVDAVLAGMTSLGYPPKDIFGARLALEEAVCNSLKHGHQHDPTKVVEVRYRIRSDSVLIEVKDEGPGFDPRSLPDPTAPENLERPCGRGLLLLRHYAKWVRYNRKGNCVTFCICASEPLHAAQAGETSP
jgi:serine/threonine-protein kinase RsbW